MVAVLDTSFTSSPVDDELPYQREPLSSAVRVGLMVSVIFFHVGCGWALTQIPTPKLMAGDAAPMEVRMVASEAAAPAPQINVAPPEDTPPPDLQPEMESIIQPPPPDLPPPVFPVQAPPPPPPQPKPKPPIQKPAAPVQPPPGPPRPAQEASAPASVQGQPGPPAATAAPKTVGVSQVTFLVRPNPVYPARSQRANEQGTATIRVLIDATGRPSQVSLQASSGFPALDESAVSAVRAAQFRPYSDGGVPQPVWVLVPIKFVLQ